MGSGSSVNVMDLLSDYFEELGKMTKRDRSILEEKFKKMLIEGDKTPAQIVAILADDLHSLPPIRLIDFDSYKKHGEIPRYPEQSDLTTNLDTIDRSISFVVFISHCWLAGWNGLDKNGDVVSQYACDNWRGQPHPDNLANEKFELIVEAIEIIASSAAPGMKQIYIWNDFSCINQDGNPAGELQQLDKIVEMCDCLITPIVDLDLDEHKRWKYPTVWSNPLSEYKSVGFNGTPYSYLQRAWCRIEMLYAANIPLPRDTVTRIANFDHGLKFCAENGLRPQYLYGAIEKREHKSPLQLPPLAYKNMRDFSPLLVLENLSDPSDEIKIKELLQELSPYIKEIKHGYTGERNDKGQKHGRGIMILQDGTKFEGSFFEDKFHGQGVCTWNSGNVYKGSYNMGKKDGKGFMVWGYGDTYDGSYVDDRKEGFGTFSWASGNIYSGYYLNNMKHGKGLFTWHTGEKYDGEYAEDKKCGQGTFTWPSGNQYIGCWKTDLMDGKGTKSYANGNSYSGEYLEDKMHGHGIYTWKSGTIFEGEYDLDKRSGFGKFVWPTGNIYEGFSENDRRSGSGAFTWADGNSYEGEYRNDKRTGMGKFTWKSGEYFEGLFEADKMNGDGIFYSKDGEIVEQGVWNNDKFIG